MIEIILSSFNQLFNAIDIFLKQKDLTLGAILAGLAPFIVIYIKISKEKEKMIQRKLVERRQMQIAFNINEILEALKVESKWSIQEIGSEPTVRKNLSQSLITLIKATFKKKLSSRRKILVAISRKLLMAIFGAVILVFNQQLGWSLDSDSIIGACSLVISYIIGQSIVDTNGLGQFAPLLEKLKSKKLWAAVVGSIVIVLNDYYHWGMNSESIYMLAGTGVSFIIGKSAISVVKAAKNTSVPPSDDQNYSH